MIFILSPPLTSILTYPNNLEHIGVSYRPMLFDAQTTISPILSDIKHFESRRRREI